MEIIKSRKINNIKLQNLFIEALPSEINIFNQAHLEIENVETKKFSQKHSNSLSISFLLEGDIELAIYCISDYPNESQSGFLGFNESLFIESMNILLGKLVTNMEKEIMFDLSPPQYIKDTVKLEAPILEANYELFTYKQVRRCKLIFRVNND